MIWSLKKLIEDVPDEQAAIRFLQERKLIPTSQICYNGHTMKLNLSKRIRWRCWKEDCHAEKSIRNGSWFCNSKMSLCLILQYIYLWSIDRSLFVTCKRELGMGVRSIVQWSQALREVCAKRMKSSENIIGGPGLFVEIGESLHPKSNKKINGKVMADQWMFGGICRESKECFVVPVPNCSEATLLPIIRQRIKPGSIIISDHWKKYRNFQKMESDHLTYNLIYNFVGYKTVSNDRQLKKIWSFIKSENLKRRGTDRKYLEHYLAEFMWRKNFSATGTDLFEQILSDIRLFHESGSI